MIKTDIILGHAYTIDDLKAAIAAHIPVSRDELSDVQILKKTLRIDGKELSYKLSVGITLTEEREAGLLKMKKKCAPAPELSLDIPRSSLNERPIIVGAGPAGLLCALTLSEAGARPIVLERGEQVERRAGTVSAFFKEASLDPESNIQFGEGGAGAFSDGKLKFGAPDKYNRRVLSELVEAGAPEDIMYTVGAHLGTDKLPLIVARLREKAISLGAEFVFRAKVVDILLGEGRVRGVKYERNGECRELFSDTVVIAQGHSARDTLEMLFGRGVRMEQRPFGIGMRIEHPREYINELVYGDRKLADLAGTASYHLVTHLDSGRSVYSFCMCPGGTVVAAASERGGIVTNGMSEQARDADNSNAAFLVSLTPSDFGSEHPLAGIYLQRKIEKAAFAASGGYNAPAIRMDDFLDKSKTLRAFGEVIPSYPIGTLPVCPEEYLPSFVTDSLRAGIYDFDKWMPGFMRPDATLTGAETRSTSPVRIPRDEAFRALGIEGLYPIGEGAGYSGGIVSSAADGVRAAMAILSVNTR